MDWFKFHTIWGEGLQELTDAEAGRFLRALCKYAETGEIEATTGNERYMLSMALKQMKRDAERSARISGVRAEAGRAGGLQNPKQMQANASKTSNCLQNEAKQANASIKNKNKNKNKESEPELINCADAQLQTQATEATPALTPDNDAWWNPFGERKELAIAFYRETKLYPMSGEWGHWQKDLARFVEAGIGGDLMTQAVRKIRAEGKLSIKSPGSVFSTARWLLSRQSLPQPPAQTSQRRMSAVEIAELMSENQQLDETEIIDI